jgi:hypothetical protein
MNQGQLRRGSVVFGLGLIVVMGCAASLFPQEEMPGQRFDRAMKQLAANCAKAKLKPNDTACDILKLKPADPLATEEGRFAHSIKIPNSVPEDSGYKPGMTSEQYFEHLCKTEAGEFIYKTVENVDGLYMLRPRNKATDYELEHLYALEDPYGAVDTGASKPQDYLVQPPFGQYEFLEAPLPYNDGSAKQARFIRYFRGDPQNSKKDFVFMKGSHSERVPYVVETEPSDVLKSHYGYTWRGITRPHDRKSGIAGSELILLDLKGNEVLGVQRRFIRSGGVRNNLTGIWWLNGQVCEQFGGKSLHTTEFISKVLRSKSAVSPAK